MTPPSSDSMWFYADATHQTTGPVSFSELKRLAFAGAIHPDTFVIAAGATEWRRYAEVTRQGSLWVTSQAPALAAASQATSGKPWHQKLWLIPVGIFFCFPFAIALIWLNKDLKNVTKILLTGLSVFVGMMGLVITNVGGSESQPLPGPAHGMRASESSNATKSADPTESASGLPRYKQFEIEVVQRQVEDLDTEFGRLLGIVESGHVTAQTAGEIKIWKTNIRSTRQLMGEREVNQFGASGRLSFALDNMELAWSSLEKTARGDDRSMTHTDSIKLLKENLRDARQYISEGKF